MGCVATKAVFAATQWPTIYPLVVSQTTSVMPPTYTCPSTVTNSRQDPSTGEVFCYDASGYQVTPIALMPGSVYVTINPITSDPNFSAQAAAYRTERTALMAFSDGGNEVVYVYDTNATTTTTTTTTTATTAAADLAATTAATATAAAAAAPPPTAAEVAAATAAAAQPPTAAEIAAAAATATAADAIRGSTPPAAQAQSSIDATAVYGQNGLYPNRKVAQDAAGSTECQSPTFACQLSRTIAIPDYIPSGSISAMTTDSGYDYLVTSDESNMQTYIIDPRKDKDNVRIVCETEQWMPVGKSKTGAFTMLSLGLRPGTRDNQLLLQRSDPNVLVQNSAVVMTDTAIVPQAMVMKKLLFAMSPYDFSQMVMTVSDLQGLVKTLFEQPARDKCYDIFELIQLGTGQNKISERTGFQFTVPFAQDADGGLKVSSVVKAVAGVPVGNNWVIMYSNAAGDSLVGASVVPMQPRPIKSNSTELPPIPVVRPFPPELQADEVIWSWASIADTGETDLTMQLSGTNTMLAHCTLPVDPKVQMVCDYPASTLSANKTQTTIDTALDNEDFVGAKVLGSKAKKEVGDEDFGKALSKYMVGGLKQQLNTKMDKTQQPNIPQVDTQPIEMGAGLSQDTSVSMNVRKTRRMSMGGNEDKITMGQFMGNEGFKTSAILTSLDTTTGGALQMVSRGSDGNMVVEDKEKLPYDSNGTCVAFNYDDAGGPDLACSITGGVRIIPNINETPVATAKLSSDGGNRFESDTTATRESGEKHKYDYKFYEIRDGNQIDRPDLLATVTHIDTDPTVGMTHDKIAFTLTDADKAAVDAQKSVGIIPDVNVSAGTKAVGVASAPVSQNGLFMDVTVTDAGGLSNTKKIPLASYATKAMVQGDVKASTLNGTNTKGFGGGLFNTSSLIGGCSLIR